MEDDKIDTSISLKKTGNSSLNFKNILQRVDFKIGIKTGITAGIAWIVGMQIAVLTDRPESLISGLWCTLAAIVVTQANLGGTYRAAWNRFFGVLIGTMFGGLCTGLLGSNPISLSISIFFTVLFSALFNVKDSVRIACLSVAVVMVLWGLRPDLSPWVFAFYRFLDSVVGILIAVIIAHTLWPNQALEKLKLNMAHLLTSIQQYFELATRDVLSNHYVAEEAEKISIEISLLAQQNMEFLGESKLELWMLREGVQQWIDLDEKILHLFTYIEEFPKVYHPPQKIFDEDLHQHVTLLVAAINGILHEFSLALIERRIVSEQPLLKVTGAKQNLDRDLLRFRSSRITRNFDIIAVEDFFTLFHHLNAICEQFGSITKLINAINEEE